MARNTNQAPPVSEGDEIDVLIESVGDKGDGVCRVQGFVIFVDGAKKDEWIKVRISKVLPKVAFAKKIGPAAPKEMPVQARKKMVDNIDFESLGEGSEDFGEE